MIDLYRLVGPLLRCLEAETAHDLTVTALERGIAPRARGTDDAILYQRLWGIDFPNPIGLAAGFDKDARAFRAILKLGFGFTEIGTVTPLPQIGNPRPRLFRLTHDEAVINRMGFNNRGLEAAARRLEARARQAGIVGANVGKNKDQTDAIADYVAGVRRLAPLADYLVVNVSSPNTPGLRALQMRGPLGDLIGAAKNARDEAGAIGSPPLLLKIAPDLSPEERADVAEVALASGIDGLIVGNTTVSRPPGLREAASTEPGGLSGRPLLPLATAVLADMYRLTRGRLPIIGVGGIASGADAYAKIRAGASLVQLYTALVYQGPELVSRIKNELVRLLQADGFATIAQAIGADHGRMG
ncbi:MAG: quinone-dependent dihydroorotate dehydrogenase [Alphaproteobacteria bacterium]|nr:quinone-dependent dihydroorotate dehydrogenase [Alphaproteobacteria bacterium]